MAGGSSVLLLFLKFFIASWRIGDTVIVYKTIHIGFSSFFYLIRYGPFDRDRTRQGIVFVICEYFTSKRRLNRAYVKRLS